MVTKTASVNFIIFGRFMALFGKNNSGNEMSFLEHLEVLRWHLVRIVSVILIFGVAFFIFSRYIFDHVILVLAEEDFWTYQQFCKLSHFLGLEDNLCMTDLKLNFQSISMSGQITTDLVVSLIGGFIVAFPYVFFEIWRFIAPALKSKEKKYAAWTVFFSTILFVGGILFAYYLIAPLTVQFLGNYQVSEKVAINITINSYITTVSTVILACGIVFQLPLMVYFLSKIGILTPEFMRKYRKHAIVITLILAAIITPPDISSQILVSLPILLLYEVSIFISASVNKRKKKLANG